MQSKTLLQPAALGADLTSDESKASIITVTGTPQGLKVGDYFWLNGQFVVIEDIGLNHISNPKTNRMYTNQEDQATYRQLRQQGLKRHQAIEAMRLMGIEAPPEPVHDAISYGVTSYDGIKKKLPHYHGRRRF